MENENDQNLGNNPNGSTQTELDQFKQNVISNTCLEANEAGNIIDNLNSDTGHGNTESNFFNEGK